MRTLNEPQYHALMAVLAVGSLFLDQGMERALPTWSMPKISLVTFVLGLCWLALFCAFRIRGLHDRIRVLEDRLDRLSQRADGLEDGARRRHDLPR